MGLESAVVSFGVSFAAGLSVEAIKAISPLLVASMPGQPSAHDAWMQLHGNTRLKSLLESVQDLEAKNQVQTISEAEKLSPGSSYTKALQEYITTPLEEKVQLLHNALINGLYGDWTIELREDFYRIAASIQPLDTLILKYLVSACPSLWVFYDTQAEIADALTYKKIKSSFTEPDIILRRSLDRLQQVGLIYNNGANRVGLYNPYCEFIPFDLAQSFLAFIADSRNAR